MMERIVLIGAGSAMFTRGLVADLIRAGQAAHLALVDTDPEALAIAERLAGKMITAASAPVSLAASTDRRDVLRDATAVICTVGVGGRRAWERDVFVSRRHGIFVPVGDTVGPGGASRALRMIPAMVAIAEDVLDLAPGALFFNYGNPMAPVCRAVRKATGANVVGLCHGVSDVARYLAAALDVPHPALEYTAVGLNHLTWFVEVKVNGRDALPDLQRLAESRIAQGDNPFSWRLLQSFGAFPAVLDRHVTEFFPQFFREGRYYGRTLGIDAFSFEETIAWGDQRFADMREAAHSPAPLGAGYLDRQGGEHEQVVQIIRSIRQGTGEVYSANLPNTGQAPTLPADAILEGPAVADRDGVRALPQPRLPPGLAGTLAARLMWVETVVEAALAGSRELFIQAMVLDGSSPSLEAAAALSDDLLRAQAEYLPWVR